MTSAPCSSGNGGQHGSFGVATRRTTLLLATAFILSAAAFHAEGHVRFDATGREAHREWVVLALWSASIVFFLLGAASLGASRRLRPPRWWLGWTSAALVFILVVASGTRLIGLGRLPGNLSGDEAALGVFSREVLAGRWHDPFTTGLASHPSLWFYVQALALKVLDDGVVGIRLLMGLIGVATVVALYVFARRFYGASVGLIAVALLATYHFHIHFSRVGINQGVDALFAVIGFGLVLAGWKERSPLLLAAGGVSVGVAQNLYYGTRLEVVVLMGFLVFQLLVSRHTFLLLARYLPLLIAGVLVGWGPGLRVPLFQWDDYSARLAVVGVLQSGWFDARRELGEGTLEILGHQVFQSAGALTSVADRGPHYASGIPLLDPVSSVLFVIGVALLLFRWRRPESALLLTWLVGAIVFGGVLLVNPPESQRFVTLAPLVCLVIAIGLDFVGRAALRVMPTARTAVRAATAVAVVALALWNLNFYFREYSPRNAYGFRQTEVTTAIGRSLADQGDRTVYFLGAPYAYVGDPTIRFLAPRAEGVDLTTPEALGRLPCPEGAAPQVVFHQARLGEARAVHKRYPGSPLRIYVSEVDGAPLFAVYDLECRP